MYNATIKVLEKINSNDFEAYVVGGYPRDIYLGRKSSDVDICTNATPKDIKDIFKNVILPNNEYGSVTVIYNKVRFEITTYRKDLKYINNRIPSKVKYTDDLFEDLRRRDFTINTLCMNSNGEIIDVLGIKDDIDSRLIKTVGDAKSKISEDSLRILRAIRFATILDFELDKDLKKAIKKYGYLLQKLSYYRKKEELNKIFSSVNIEKGLKLIKELDLDKYLELKNLDNLVITPSTINIWAQLDVTDTYTFTNNDKDTIIKVNEVRNKELTDYVLYKYGLYICSLATEFKAISKKDIIERYNNLSIHSKSDINITVQEICEVLDKKAGSFIKDVYAKLEEYIVLNKLENDNKKIKEFIKANF